jgi:predicted aspartyl protease
VTWVGTFRVSIEVGDSRGEHFLPVEAVADTGATYTLVPASLLRHLGVTPRRKVSVILADGRRREWDLGRAWVLVNGQAEPSLVIFGDDGQDPILGAYTLEGSASSAIGPIPRQASDTIATCAALQRPPKS